MSDTPAESSDPNLPVLARPTPTRTPGNQLGDLPREELEAIAEEFGLKPRDYRESADLVSAIHARRQLISTLERAAMQDVLAWAGRSLPPTVSVEQLAIEVAKIRSMRFNGLSDKGLVTLALLRGVDVSQTNSRDDLIYELKSQEGFFAKMKRKTRGWMGKRVEKMMGDPVAEMPVPTGEPINKPTEPGGATPGNAAPRQQALREEIEESGLFSGIANRVKKQADSYVNQKLDEIEARIDRKLDEIDRRLAEWRDKEIANRIRILKITLWASVVVAAVSLVYSYIQVEREKWQHPPQNQNRSLIPSTTHTQPAAPTPSTAPTAMTTAIHTNQSFTI